MEDSSLLMDSWSVQSSSSYKDRDVFSSNSGLVVLLGAVVVLSQVGATILTPLWLDSVHAAKVIHNGNDSKFYTYFTSEAFNFVDDRSRLVNVTTAYDSSHHVAAFFLLVFTTSLHVVFFGIVLLFLWKCFPGKYITDRELFYPKSEFVIVGISSSFSSLLCVYSSSGRRTAPFLQAVLMNFAIPITFVIRFILLKKRPTARKLVCALVVLLAEVLSLLTTIFPHLEPHEAVMMDGGAPDGAGRVLWPLCFVLSFVPNAVSRCLVESHLKGEKNVFPSCVHVNPIFFLFWQYLTMVIVYWVLFWVDIIPGFGTSSNITEFGRTLVFNLECVFGGGGCSWTISLVACLCITALILQNLAYPLFLKNAEGSNYAVIITALQTPLVLLFWTLFIEEPFHWYPHLHLSTWLSLAAVAIMIPAIYIYNTGNPEKVISDESRPCLGDTVTVSGNGIQSVLRYGSTTAVS